MSNASKFGFIALVNWLKKQHVFLIDCQQETAHLSSLGARNIGREDFLKILVKNSTENLDLLRGVWKAD